MRVVGCTFERDGDLSEDRSDSYHARRQVDSVAFDAPAGRRSDYFDHLYRCDEFLWPRTKEILWCPLRSIASGSSLGGVAFFEFAVGLRLIASCVG